MTDSNDQSRIRPGARMRSTRPLPASCGDAPDDLEDDEASLRRWLDEQVRFERLSRKLRGEQVRTEPRGRTAPPLRDLVAEIAREVPRTGRELLRLREAASWLPMRDSDALKWLKKNGLVRRLDGRPVVIKQDVLNFLRSQADEAPRRDPGRHPVSDLRREPL